MSRTIPNCKCSSLVVTVLYNMPSMPQNTLSNKIGSLVCTGFLKVLGICTQEGI